MAGITALQFCIFRGNDAEAIRLIESGEADVNASDKGGQTPLHLACYRDNVDIARRLVEAGANSLKADNSGNAPIHAAVGAGSVSVVRYLLERGVPRGTRNGEKLTPLDVAEMYCPPRRRAAILEAFRTIADGQETTEVRSQSSLPPSPSTVSSTKAFTPRAPGLNDVHAGVGGREGGANPDPTGNGPSSSAMLLAAGGAFGTSGGAQPPAIPSGISQPAGVHKMLARQQKTIEALTEVVKSQAETIASLVAVISCGPSTGSAFPAPAAAGAGAAAATAAAAENEFSKTSSQPGANNNASAMDSMPAPAGNHDDAEVVAEMVAYLEDGEREEGERAPVLKG